jgi:hypothetical protein
VVDGIHHTPLPSKAWPCSRAFLTVSERLKSTSKSCAFVRLRQILASHADLACKLEALEKKYDAQFKIVFDAIRELMEPAGQKPKRKIGLLADR